MMIIQSNKYIQQKQMQTFDAHSLALIKYQPEEILLLHKSTRNVYRYLNCQNNQTLPQVQHSSMLTGISFDHGLLYLKEQSNLFTEISTRARSHVKKQFSQEEICNTFIPLLDCIRQIHKKGGVHGSIHPQNILIIDNQIKIRDGRAPTKLTQSYYSDKKEQASDFLAFGLCIVNCILLTTEKPEQNQLQTLIEKNFENFSKPFIMMLMILSKKRQSQYKEIQNLLKGESSYVQDKVFQSYELMRMQRERKRKYIINQENIGYNHINTIKKIGANSGIKKAVHFQNSQNKLEEQSAKCIERLNKAFEKCCISHELMTKKLNEEEKKVNQETLKRNHKTPILNLSNFGVQNSHKKNKERMSPLQRPKNYSKKK